MSTDPSDNTSTNEKLTVHININMTKSACNTNRSNSSKSSNTYNRIDSQLTSPQKYIYTMVISTTQTFIINTTPQPH